MDHASKTPFEPFIDTFGTMQSMVHGLARSNGFWDSTRNVGEMIALIHSELSEALEGDRKKIRDNHLPHRPSIEVELADAVIRIMDMAQGLDLDIAGAIVEKHFVNAGRPYRHGKLY